MGYEQTDALFSSQSVAVHQLSSGKKKKRNDGFTGVNVGVTRHPVAVIPLRTIYPRRLLVLRSDSKVTVHFVNRDGEKITVKGSPGDTLLDVVINEDLDIDGFGACEGTLACSTCHLIFDEDVYKKLGRVTDEEMDMLDLAYGLTDTSRLGCQICLSKSLDGMVARVPESVADIRQSKDGSS